MESKNNKSQFETTLSAEVSRTFDTSHISRIYIRHKRREKEHKALLPKNRIRSISRETLHSHNDKGYNLLYEPSPRRKKEKLRQARNNADSLLKKENTFATDSCSSKSFISRAESSRDISKLHNSFQKEQSENICKHVNDLYRENESTSMILNTINNRYRRSVVKNINDVINSSFSKENEFSENEVSMILKTHNKRITDNSTIRLGMARRSLTGRRKSIRCL